ncbi:MAG: hypothetical protein K5739_11650 [Lachnospiraceae bacterium]|nr:hypothetical protein [Lachnospiraceae bacterium]
MKRTKMIKMMFFVMLFAMAAYGCGAAGQDTTPETADTVTVDADESATDDADTLSPEAQDQQGEQEEKKEQEEQAQQGETAQQEEQVQQEQIDDASALDAIRNYCYEQNPDLKEMEASGEYTIFWDIESSDEKQIVVLFRSYTAAQIRYYIDRASGDTYVTEFVPGITEEEEKTEESFQIRDYIASSGAGEENKAPDALDGTWKSASIVENEEGMADALFYVQFTEKEISYGHMKDGVFTLDHADPITLITATPDGGSCVQARSQSGTEYTYRTAEGDNNVMEYYETWKEEEFPDKYSAGASISR